eukprot:TRINITY_DN20582_c0_g2_i1.p1 TRINITY_DN20582_c0_g2~~TRINITY_DN20582_c0_g2_i1.p1  ORF type:complete len:1032 (-),score=182.76 TRINITY_DN20582_c0_g2_i1:41-3136(-)
MAQSSFHRIPYEDPLSQSSSRPGSLNVPQPGTPGLDEAKSQRVAAAISGLQMTYGGMPAMSNGVVNGRAQRGMPQFHQGLPAGAVAQSSIRSDRSPAVSAAQSPVVSKWGVNAASIATGQGSMTGSIAFASEEATMGKWRRSVQEFSDAFEVRESLAQMSSDEPPADANSARERSGGYSSGSASESEDVGHQPCGFVLGLHQYSPETYHWMMARMGTKKKVCLVLCFMVLEACKFLLAKGTFVPGVNMLSILVVENFASLVLAALVSIFLEGGRVVSKLLSWQQFCRFMIAAVLFSLASGLVLCAYRTGTSPIEVVTVGYIHMPITVVLSYFAFRRRYGKLEWIAVGMMTLGVLALVLLREESKEEQYMSFNLVGFVLVVSAVLSSVVGSILAERILKDRHSSDQSYEFVHERFYVMKFHLDLSSLAVAALLWVIPMHQLGVLDKFMKDYAQSKEWFGDWQLHQYLMVPVMVLQGWAAGLITREFSTVIRTIVQTLALVAVMMIGDPIRDMRFHFALRLAPSLLLTTIILMSAVIFHRGRINLKVIRKACNLDAEAHPSLQLGSLAKPEESAAQSPIPNMNTEAWSGNEYLKDEDKSKLLDDGSTPRSNKEESTEAVGNSCEIDSSTICSIVTTYALILVYIISDAGRTLLLQKALSTTVTNSTTMGLVCYVVGVIIASCLTVYTDGLDGLRRAWSPKKILLCLPAAFLFALATALGNLAFANGISPALYLVLGKFYTPVAAFMARWIMGKFYMWLEWLALIILTLSSAAFGYLQAYSPTKGAPSPGSIIAMSLVICSAAVSALASLVTEKILKGEADPFHLQKVRLDAGSVLSSLVLLPVIGMIATRPQDVPWALRPESYETCPASSVCWDLSTSTCHNSGCTCRCTSGIFAGWDTPLLFLAVAVNTAQGWMVGKVTQRFSVVHRAIADSFSLLGIYFIGDPLFNGKSLSNSALNLVAMIVPLSTATFSAATSEMQRAFEAQKKLEHDARKTGRLRVNSADFDTDDESVILGDSVLGSASDKSPTPRRGE